MLGFGERGKRDEFGATTKPHLDTLYRAALRMTGDAEARRRAVMRGSFLHFLPRGESDS